MAGRLTGPEIIGPRAAADCVSLEIPDEAKPRSVGISGFSPQSLTISKGDRGISRAQSAKKQRKLAVSAADRTVSAADRSPATKMALWATQQPQRGGTTSCASRPSAGIDRAKRLISLKATGEQGTLLCTVTLKRAAALVSGHTLRCRPRRGSCIWNMSLGAGPSP